MTLHDDIEFDTGHAESERLQALVLHGAARVRETFHGAMGGVLI